MSERDLTSWFARRRESVALKMTRDHSAKIVDTVTELEKGLVAASKGNVTETKQAVQRLFAYETEADGIRRDIAVELTKGDLPPKDREDLMHLIKRLDTVADWAKDASRNLTLLLQVKVTSDLWQKLSSMGHHLVECAWALRRSIEELDKDVEKTLGLLTKVDELEHKVDEDYFDAKITFLAHKELEPPAFIILRDLLHDMEQVADMCADTADLIRIIAIRAR